MVSPEDAINIYKKLMTQGIQVWVTGGWGIDALLGEQTRPHKDLDVIMLLEDVTRLRQVLAGDGYGLIEIWEENRRVIDVHGIEIDTAFVLQDREGRQIDVHALHFDDQGQGIPDWEAEEGFIFTPQDLAGKGMIADVAVRCVSPEKQMACHTGYELPEKQVGDLKLLHEMYGVKYCNDKSSLK